MMTAISQKITPFLWFDKEAGEAAAFYTSLFPNSRMLSPESFSDTPSGKIDIYTIELSGQQFALMNAGPQFKFNEAISFVIDCRDQEEVDYYWDRLTEDGGEESMCGWLKDKFGVSWQVVPRRFNELVADDDKEKVGRVMQAMLKMKKLDIAELEKAFTRNE
jgi:predicted 3-demethylubiquinone-9 3-methyltransferase (glyoxalase superfamily)